LTTSLPMNKTLFKLTINLFYR